MTNQSVSNPNLSIEWSIAQERLRQAHLSFNLALIATAVSFSISLIGGCLLLSNRISSGTITSAAGLFSSAGCLKFAKDANDRLDKILDELADESKIAVSQLQYPDQSGYQSESCQPSYFEHDWVKTKN